jgi:hypothetical protein
MQWDRSKTIGIAKTSCSQCHGYGLRPGRRGLETPCACVYRAIFRACFGRFQNCISRERNLNTVTMELCSGRDGRRFYSRKSEEFIADFELVSRRTLEPFEYKLFRYHFLLGADRKLCCRQLNIDRGLFFHVVYTIQQKLGRVFAELEPYSLFPLDEYFGGTTRSGPVDIETYRTQAAVGQAKPGRNWKPPLARIA